VCYEQKLFVFGGFVTAAELDYPTLMPSLANNNALADSVEMYDVRTDKWTVVQRGAHCKIGVCTASVRDDRIFLLSCGEGKSFVGEFDPIRLEWKSSVCLLTVGEQTRLMVLHEQTAWIMHASYERAFIYALDRHKSEQKTDDDSLDVSPAHTFKWIVPTIVGGSVSILMAFEQDGQLFSLWTSPNVDLTRLYVWDPVVHKWTECPALPFGRLLGQSSRCTQQPFCSIP
jgi:hypothetical protein